MADEYVRSLTNQPPFRIDYRIEDLINIRRNIYYTGFLLCGETHGIQENFETYLLLIEKFGIKSIGLEIDNNTYEFLLRLKPEELVNNPLLNLQIKSKQTRFLDGRVSLELVAFIYRLRKMGKKVLFF